MSEPLTLAEAVPLGTVYLQRLLVSAGIRSLVIKGPAFVELGVRKPRQSNDIDLMVAPGDRAAATGPWPALGGRSSVTRSHLPSTTSSTRRPSGMRSSP